MLTVYSCTCVLCLELGLDTTFFSSLEIEFLDKTANGHTN